jgi:transposase InsO family protein
MPHSESVLDSGASHHMSPDSSSFTSVSHLSFIPVMTADGTPMPLAGVGSVVTPHLSLPNVYLIPQLKLNLVSVGQICDFGDYLVMFYGSFCCVQDLQSQKLIGTGRRENELYILDGLKVSVAAAAAATTVDLSSFHLSLSFSSFYLWHSCLSHVSFSRLRFLAPTGVLGNLKTCDISDCSGCKLANFSALPFNQSISISSSPFDLIHSDVWGSSPVAIKGGSRYYVSFIDDHTRYCWVYLMKHRSEFFEIYAAFRALIKTQHSIVIKCFRCDLGGDYTSNKFYQMLALDGTIHQTSYTGTLEQNGVAERKHRHIVETARSLLLFTFVPSEFWGEVVLTAVSLINTILSSHSSGLSPFEKLYGYVPDYSSFRVFGYTCFILRPHIECSKLSSRSAIFVFLGYGEGKKGFHCFDPITQKLYVSIHVVFLEHIPFFCIPSTTHSLIKSDLIRIYPFSEDSGNDTSLYVRSICTHNSAGTGYDTSLCGNLGSGSSTS